MSSRRGMERETMASVFVLLFFLPLAAIYGRRRARVLAWTKPNLGGRLAALIPMPALIGVSATIAIIAAREDEAARLAALSGRQTGDSVLATGNGVLDFTIAAARSLGDLSLVLFFLAIPFVLGAAIAAVLLVLQANGRITLAPLQPTQDDPAT